MPEPVDEGGSCHFDDGLYQLYVIRQSRVVGNKVKLKGIAGKPSARGSVREYWGYQVLCKWHLGSRGGRKSKSRPDVRSRNPDASGTHPNT